MEPLSGALTFATLAGLLADYRSSKDRAESAELQEFINWLQEHRHEEMVRLITNNHTTTISVKAALAENTDRLLGELAEIGKLIAALSSSTGSVRDIALNVSPESAMSEQSREILEAFETLAAGKALLHHTFDGASLFFLDGKKSGAYEPSEPRMFDADLTELCESGLLDVGFNQNGQKVFQITRRGAHVGKNLLEQRAKT